MPESVLDFTMLKHHGVDWDKSRKSVMVLSANHMTLNEWSGALDSSRGLENRPGVATFRIGSNL